MLKEYNQKDLFSNKYNIFSMNRIKLFCCLNKNYIKNGFEF